MATIVNTLTDGDLLIAEVSSDPSVSPGLKADVSSIALLIGTGTVAGMWLKTGTANTAWTPLVTLNNDFSQTQVLTASSTISVGQLNNIINSASATTQSLPQASTALKTINGVSYAQPYTFSNWGTGVVTLSAFSGDTIVGATTALLKFQYSSLTLLPSSLGWSIN